MLCFNDADRKLIFDITCRIPPPRPGAIHIAPKGKTEVNGKLCYWIATKPENIKMLKIMVGCRSNSV